MPDIPLEIFKNAVKFVHVHTHPFSKRVPPSGSDILGYDQLETLKNDNRLGVELEYVVVQHDRIWITSMERFQKKFSRLGQARFNADYEAIQSLEAIYICEIHENLGYNLVKPCDNIQDSERVKAIRDLLKIYRGWGVTIEEQKLDPGFYI